MIKRIAISSIILTSLLLGYFFEPGERILPNQSITTKKDINFYLDDIESRSFNQAGIHTNTLTTPYAAQYTGQSEIQMQQPHLLIALNAIPWLAEAKIGITSANQKMITLSEDVTLVRSDGTADVHTEKLIFDSATEVAYTPSPVAIYARGSKTFADGIHIDLNHEIIQLKNHVRTYYAP